MLVPAGISCSVCGGIGLVFVPAEDDFGVCQGCLGWCFLECGWVDDHPADAKPAPGFYAWRGHVVRNDGMSYVNIAVGEINLVDRSEC